MVQRIAFNNMSDIYYCYENDQKFIPIGRCIRLIQSMALKCCGLIKQWVYQ